MKNEFKIELKKWMKNSLSPYCLNSCKNSCCECFNDECIYIDRGYEHLFKTNKLNGKKVCFSNKKLKPNIPHLYKDGPDWYFTGGICPNYDSKNKKCMIYNQHPMCAIFPLEKIDEGYKIVDCCEIHKMDPSQEPLKSLFEIFKKNKMPLIR
jgi:hypothetical protein